MCIPGAGLDSSLREDEAPLSISDSGLEVRVLTGETLRFQPSSQWQKGVRHLRVAAAESVVRDSVAFSSRSIMVSGRRFTCR